MSNLENCPKRIPTRKESEANVEVDLDKLLAMRGGELSQLFAPLNVQANNVKQAWTDVIQAIRENSGDCLESVPATEEDPNSVTENFRPMK